MQTERSFEVLLDDLVAAIEERECADHDARDFHVDARIRRLERALLERYHQVPRKLHWPSARIRVDPRAEGLPAPRSLALVATRPRP
jgi:hypothetical protein